MLGRKNTRVLPRRWNPHVLLGSMSGSGYLGTPPMEWRQGSVVNITPGANGMRWVPEDVRLRWRVQHSWHKYAVPLFRSWNRSGHLRGFYLNFSIPVSPRRKVLRDNPVGFPRRRCQRGYNVESASVPCLGLNFFWGHRGKTDVASL